jgi:hypothetical protein
MCGLFMCRYIYICREEYIYTYVVCRYIYICREEYIYTHVGRSIYIHI